MKNRKDVIRRVLTAIRLLQSSRPTLPEMASALGCSERTARRYIETIAEQAPVCRHGPHYRMTEAPR